MWRRGERPNRKFHPLINKQQTTFVLPRRFVVDCSGEGSHRAPIDMAAAARRVVHRSIWPRPHWEMPGRSRAVVLGALAACVARHTTSTRRLDWSSFSRDLCRFFLARGHRDRVMFNVLMIS